MANFFRLEPLICLPGVISFQASRWNNSQKYCKKIETLNFPGVFNSEKYNYHMVLVSRTGIEN